MKTAGQFINILKWGSSDKKLSQIQKITKKNHFNSDTHSLTDFSIYICCLSFPVSIQTLYSLIYIPFSSSPTPFCLWPVDWWPTVTLVFCHKEVINSVRTSEICLRLLKTRYIWHPELNFMEWVNTTLTIHYFGTHTRYKIRKFIVKFVLKVARSLKCKIT